MCLFVFKNESLTGLDLTKQARLASLQAPRIDLSLSIPAHLHLPQLLTHPEAPFPPVPALGY